MLLLKRASRLAQPTGKADLADRRERGSGLAVELKDFLTRKINLGASHIAVSASFRLIVGLPPRPKVKGTPAPPQNPSDPNLTLNSATMRRQALKLLPRLVQGQQAAVARGSLLGFRGFADDANLKHTTLYDFHVAHGGEGSAIVAV
jgi:hypothetical protein